MPPLADDKPEAAGATFSGWGLRWGSQPSSERIVILEAWMGAISIAGWPVPVAGVSTSANA